MKLGEFNKPWKCESLDKINLLRDFNNLIYLLSCFICINNLLSNVDCTIYQINIEK